MVPEELAGRGSRSADIAPHAKNTARRAAGLEGTLVDKQRMDIASLDTNDARVASMWVAGPGALLVAKTHKIRERSDQIDRTRDKDALDVLRLLRVFDAALVAARLQLLLEDELARAATRRALDLLPELFGTRTRHGVESAVRAAGASEDPDTIALSLMALIDDVLASL